MSKIISAFTLATLFIFTLSSCVRDDRYDPYPPNPRQYTYADEFDNNSNGWAFADPANLAYGVVSNGTFKFDYNDDGSEAYYASKNIGFNYYNDFKLYTRIGSNNNMGLLFGYRDASETYGYSFTIDFNGNYALYDEGGNGYGPDVTTIVPPNNNTGAGRGNGDWNELRLEQRGGRWLGYVNNIEVFNVQARTIKGSNVGFVNIAFTQGEADYLQVDWLD